MSVARRVMVFGTFDSFHEGHRYFLESARAKGDELVVVVGRDETVKGLKGFLRNTEAVRKSVIEANFPASAGVVVVLGDLVDHMAAVREFCPDLICLGYDQVGFSKQLQKEFPNLPLVRLPAYHPEKYKSSKMIE